MNPGQMKVPRQMRWQQEQLKKGRCRVCGKKRAKESKNFCSFHREADRARTRKYQADKAKRREK